MPRLRVRFNVFPLSGFHSDNYDALSWAGQAADTTRHMALPVLCYVIGNFAVLTLLMKNTLLELTRLFFLESRVGHLNIL